MKILNIVLSLCCLLLVLGGCHQSQEQDNPLPEVVVTLKPLYGLTSQIMHRVSKPVLLLPDYASPHTFQLKPSQRRALQQADMVIWIGPTLETFLSQPLEDLKPRYGVLTLSELPDLMVLPQRCGREWQGSHEYCGHGHDHDDEGHDHDTHEHHSHDHQSDDPHLWLSPSNAIIMAKGIAEMLITNDPAHAETYRQNLKTLEKNIQSLTAELKSTLQAVQHKPFLVYHDGYQYFEKSFGLNGAGTLVVNPNIPLSAKGLSDIHELINKKQIACVFTETEFTNLKLAKALKNPNVNVVELDPLGAKQPADEHAYENTLRALGKDLEDVGIKQQH